MPTLYRHILIAADGSGSAGETINTGLMLAEQLGAKVTALSVSHPWAVTRTCHGSAVVPLGAFAHAEAHGKSPLDTYIKSLVGHSQVDCVAVETNDHVASCILSAAESRDCDLIVVGAHARCGLSRVVLGNELAHVLTHSPVPVLLCK